MDPRATRRLTPRTATKPAKSLVRSSVSSTVLLTTALPHGGHFRRDQAGRKGDTGARLRGYFAADATLSEHLFWKMTHVDCTLSASDFGWVSCHSARAAAVGSRPSF